MGCQFSTWHCQTIQQIYLLFHSHFFCDAAQTQPWICSNAFILSSVSCPFLYSPLRLLTQAPSLKPSLVLCPYGTPSAEVFSESACYTNKDWEESKNRYFRPALFCIEKTAFAAERRGLARWHGCTCINHISYQGITYFAEQCTQHLEKVTG